MFIRFKYISVAHLNKYTYFFYKGNYNQCNYKQITCTFHHISIVELRHLKLGKSSRSSFYITSL